jgi:hypothetical protein
MFGCRDIPSLRGGHSEGTAAGIHIKGFNYLRTITPFSRNVDSPECL